ncbi:ATP-binding protein [Streptomyces sodiiphilus]|uniref:ATP-binding protein n=1 Tax=Streptomyces sodiiphilus TaxID=226217 RepID=UPI0031E245DB
MRRPASPLPPGEVDAAGYATFSLGGEPNTPASARDMTRSTLRGWGLEDLTDDAAVVVSELVTNAVRYGLPAPAHHCPLPPATRAQPVLLTLVHCGGSVLCAVFDPGTGIPVVKDPDHLMESGRGLHVLEALAHSWGWTTPDRHGKVVWALLTTPGAAEEATVEEQDVGWDPLTRLLLLLELLSGPSWLKALGTGACGTSEVRQVS